MGPLRTLIRELLHPSAGGASAPTDTPPRAGDSPAPAPTDTPPRAGDSPAPAPTPAAEQPWQVRYAPLIRRAVLWVVGVVAAYILARLGVPPEVIQVPVEVPGPVRVIEVEPAQPVPMRDAGVPIDYEGLPIDGGAPHGAEGVEQSGRRWPVDRITWSFDYASARGLASPLSEDAIRAFMKQALGWWAEGLAVEWAEVAHGSKVHIQCRFDRIDGPGRTLAYAFLADGTERTKELVFDISERWTAGPPAPNMVSAPTVAAHEIGHAMGLGHDDQGAPALMAPIYTAKVPRELPRDLERMVALGYKRRVVDPTVPGVGGTARLITFPVQAKEDDVVGALKKLGYKVEAAK